MPETEGGAESQPTRISLVGNVIVSFPFWHDPCKCLNTMSNETTTPTFPASKQDLSNLRQTATDAVNDLGSTAAVHASKAKDQFRDFAGHVQEEGGQQIDQAKEKLGDVVTSLRDYATARPLACIGAALAVGFLFGLTRRSR